MQVFQTGRFATGMLLACVSLPLSKSRARLAAGLARAGGPGLAMRDGFVDCCDGRVGPPSTDVRRLSRLRFFLDLADLNRAARISGEGGGNPADRSLDQSAPAIADAGMTQGHDSAVDLLIEQGRITATSWDCQVGLVGLPGITNSTQRTIVTRT
jgi:hypothetical protein